MSYIKKKGAGLMGLGGVSDCGADQMWFPNLTLLNITGQCATPAQAQQMLSSGQASGNLSGAVAPGSAGGGGGGSGGGFSFTDLLGKIIGGVTEIGKAKAAGAPVTNVSSTTMGIPTSYVVIGGVGVLGLVLLMRSRKSA